MDVSFLAPVFRAAGPYATVRADVVHTTENAGTELDLRVRAISQELSSQGAPAVVVAADGSVVLDEALADSPREPVTEWSAHPHPHLLPVLRQLAGRVPHVVVVADRLGADVSVATTPGRPTQEEEIDGEGFHARKVKVGGWAHSTYMHTAENQWEENAGRVADRLDDLAAAVGARFVLVAGDVRARQLLTDKAGKDVGAVLVSMDGGGRAAGADRAPVEQRATELVAEHEAHDEAQAVEQVEAASAHGLAVTGTADVVEALRKAQVETLVLADRPDDEQLFVGGEPLLIGVAAGDLAALGVDDAQQAPADRALLQAAVAGDAAVVVVPRAAMRDGAPVAAVLRYTDAATPS